MQIFDTVKLNEQYDEVTVMALHRAYEKVGKDPNQDEITVDVIMAVVDPKIRVNLIAMNLHLFNGEPNDEPVALVEVDGINMTQEEADKYKIEIAREKIMAMKDPKQRQKLIAQNLHLF